MIVFNFKKFLKKHYWLTILGFTGNLTNHIVNCMEYNYSPIMAFLFGCVTVVIFNFIADILNKPYDEYE